MKLSSVLVEVGAAAPTIMEGLVVGDASSALETIRHAACTGAREVLDNPPPALLHPCKYPLVSILYAGHEPCPIVDAPYRQGDWTPPPTAAIMGAVIMEISKDIAKPAIVFASTNDEGVLERLHVWVPNAGISAMEAELFYGSGPPSAFERRWMGDEAANIKTQRARVGSYIHSRGLNSTPLWLFDKDDCFHVIRPGAMTLLRLRKPVNDVETGAIQELLTQLPLPKEGLCDWKTLSGKLDSSTEVELFTVFSTHGVEVVLPNGDDEEPGNCLPAMEKACISALALVVLKYARDVDYYNIDDEPHAGVEVEHSEVDAVHIDEDAADISTVVESLLLRETSDVSVDHLPPSLRAKNDTLAFALKATTKLNDISRVCSYSNGQKEPIEDLTSHFFSTGDSEIICNADATFRGASEMLETIGKMMCPRQAILCVRKDAESSYHSFLYTRQGKITIGTLDDLTRLLLFTWVTPLLLERNARGSTFSEIKVQSIRREQLTVSHSARLRAARTSTTLTPEVLEGLRTLPELVTKLKDAEGKFELASKAMDDAKALYASGPPPTAANPVHPAGVPVERESETVLGFKRVIAAIEDYESRLRNVRASR